jgi:hypothetical protein
MRWVNPGIFEVTPSEGEEAPVDPADTAVGVGLDPDLATPGDADPPPADKPSPTPTNAVSKELHRHCLAECTGILPPACPACTSVTSSCAVSLRASA